MQNFINKILSFVLEVYNKTKVGVQNIYGEDLLSNYNSFLDKNIISGDLISINMTYKELILFVSIWFLIIFFIILFIRMMFALTKLIRF